LLSGIPDPQDTILEPRGTAAIDSTDGNRVGEEAARRTG